MRVKLGTNFRPALTKILNRFPIQNRRDQARQQMSVGTAHRGSERIEAQPRVA